MSCIGRLIHSISVLPPLQRQCNLERPHVCGHPLAGDLAADHLVLHNRQHLWQVENGLFPVGWSGQRTRAELYGPLLEFKKCVKVADYGGEITCPADLKGEIGGELGVGNSASCDVQVVHPLAVGDDVFRPNHLNICLAKYGPPHARHLEPIDVGPEPNQVVVSLDVGEGGHMKRASRGKDTASWLQVLVSCCENGVQHALKEQEVAHPLGDNDVKLLVGQCGLFQSPFDESYFAFQPILPHNIHRLQANSHETES